MLKRITFNEFVAEFQRQGRDENFSQAALKKLYHYLEGIKGYELDVIEICCNFTEYESLREFQDYYSSDYERLEDIERQTIVLRLPNGGFVVQNF